jgi:Domain of unknown function (DUF4412)
MNANLALIVLVSAFSLQPSALPAFEGRISVVTARGGQSEGLLYTVGTNFLRVEMTATNWPNPVDILDRNTGELTLLFPNNRSLVRLKPAADDSSAMPPGFPQMPGMPAMPNLPAPQRIGPTNLPGIPAPPAGLPPGVEPQSTLGVPAMPGMSGGMPMMPMPMEKMVLHDTEHKTNLLGFACEQYEIKQRGETMEIWATDQLFPFQPYVQNQPHRFGPRLVQEQWAELVKARKLFPLLATLKFDNGAERFHFEVTSITPQKLTDEDQKLFHPPEGYFEMEPLPF